MFKRQRQYSQFTTITVEPRRRTDDGWCWYPVVIAQNGMARVEIDGKTINDELSYEEAKNLGSKWARVADEMVQLKEVQS